NATRDWINYGFAGLNPALNTESNGRSEQNLASIEEKQRDKRVEYMSLPWAERPVQVRAGAQTYELMTNRSGVLHLNLLDGPFAEQDISRVGTLQLSVEDPQDNSRSEAMLIVSPALRGKLVEA